MYFYLNNYCVIQTSVVYLYYQIKTTMTIQLNITEIEQNNLFASFDLFLMKNPDSIDLIFTDAKEFLKQANEYHTKYICDTVTNDNKMNAIVEYLAPRIYKSLNK